MKNKKFLKKIQNIIPNHIKPKFNNEKDLFLWNQAEGRMFSKKVLIENQKIHTQDILKKSGIRKLYLNCSFKNYVTQHKEQKKALYLAQKYAQNFNQDSYNFIFLGLPGTGKNHLATAISHHLILKNYSVFLTTIADLMSTLKSTFNNHNKNFTEKKFINYLSHIDLLILDEIGIQTESKYEKIIINEIIEKRYSSKKPTGILSNLNYLELKKLLGNHIIDRMEGGDNLWIYFKWNSYRKNKF